MAVSRLFVLVILLCSLSFSASAQQQESFVFSNTPLEESLKTIARQFGVYLSYQHQLFAESDPVTGKFTDRTLPDMLQILLAENFRYKILDDYVIITEQPPPSRPVKPSISKTIYDTIRIELEERKIVYDTQRIELKVPVYDTIRTQISYPVYDTVKIIRRQQPIRTRGRVGLSVAPVYRTRESPGEAYRGVKAGWSFRYDFKKFHARINIGYQYLSNTVSDHATSVLTETHIDTVSVFYVIRDGNRTPVYVTEENETSTLVQTFIEKQNTMQLLSLEATTGIEAKAGKFSIGANMGLGIDWVLVIDEKLFFQNSESIDRSLTNRIPVFNLVFSVPLYFDHFGSLVGLEPFFYYGLSADFIESDQNYNRISAGLRLNLMFSGK